MSTSVTDEMWEHQQGGDLATPGSPKLPTSSPSGGASYLESERKRSLTTPTQQISLRKHSTASTTAATPLISVSTVAENVPLAEETDQGHPEVTVAPSSEATGETGEDVTGAGATGSQAEGEAKNTEVCPWEDEESCKVNTPFVKKYATLGYL
ncbi:hypothetical protein WDU94_003153 [Cyamophila willieti]